MNSNLEKPTDFIKYERVSYLKSKFQLLNGELFLTKDRLILISNKTTIASGLIGRFIKKKIESKKYGFNLILNEIKLIKQSKHGNQKNVLDITDISEKTHRIIVKNYDVWALMLKQTKK